MSGGKKDLKHQVLLQTLTYSGFVLWIFIVGRKWQFLPFLPVYLHTNPIGKSRCIMLHQTGLGSYAPVA
ncbi:hypothetical protein C7N43_00740 [Sphingobacteriales bacterium UPWRP_1]|nr:hypothetical protein B6N25_10475 [Sphingobacteriales bacterium TSM_CSS]PSJ79000.1 hypothetical protein C7N43_00740 [Sphingobacteriales bacterium UPWRP_1]